VIASITATTQIDDDRTQDGLHLLPLAVFLIELAEPFASFGLGPLVCLDRKIAAKDHFNFRFFTCVMHTHRMAM
jgi:hypothetical protein